MNVLAGFDTQASSSFSQTTSSAGKLAKALGSSLAMADLVGTVAPGTGTQITVAALLTRERQQDETVQSSTTVRSSNLSGGTVQIESGRDTTLQAAQVVADGQVKVLAAGDIKLLAAEQTSQSQQNSETDKSGLLSKKMLSSSVGKSEQDYKEQGTTTTSVVTQIASLGKDSQGQAVAHAHVQLQAQGGVSGEGAQMLAPAGDITVQGSSVQLLEARNEVSMASQQSSKTTAVTSQMGSTLVSAVQNIDRATELRSQAKESGDKRTQMLADLNVALAAYNAFGGGSGSPDTPTPQVGPTAGFTAGTSIGASQSSSQSQQHQSTGTQGQIVAGGDIRISAVGAGQDSNLTLQGQNVQAGGQVALSADHQVNLLASQDTASQQSSNNSSGGAVGVTFSAGGNQNGFSFQLSANKALGKADGDSTTYNNTHVTGDSVSIKSGDDTSLKGAVVTAREVSADVGGNLLIESQQDQAVYTDKQSSSGAGVSLCIPPICVGQMAVVNVSLAKANIDSDYLSVGEQSAIRAGDGGFTVKVGGDTTLTGAQITSTQAAIDNNMNSFSTGGTLTTQDLQNQAAYEAKSVSVSISTAGGGAGGYGSDSGSASSTSTAAISGIAGDSKARTGDAETGIKPIFDAAKVKQDIQLQTAVTSEFGRNASKAVGDYAGKKYKEAEKNKDKEGMEAWKEGGSARVALHALVGGLSLGGQGALGATAASTAAPLIDELQASLQKELMKAGLGEGAAKSIAGLTGAGTAAAIGSAAGGSAGATTGFNADVNNRQLSFDERQRAAKLAQQSEGKYTQKEIEDAMRNSPNSSKGEPVIAGMVVNASDENGVYDRGAVFNAGSPGTGTIVQQLPSGGKVDASLADYIISNTGGADSPYEWADVQVGKTQSPTADPNESIKMQVGPNWSYGGANSAGLESGFKPDARTQAEIDKSLNDTTKAFVLAPVAVGAIVIAPIPAAISGGANLGAQIIKGGDVSATETMTSIIMGPVGAAAAEASAVKTIIDAGGSAATAVKAGLGATTNVTGDTMSKILKGEEVTLENALAKGVAGAGTGVLPTKSPVIQSIVGEAANTAIDAARDLIKSAEGKK